VTSLTFNGTTDYARVTTVVAGMPMSFSAWAKPTAIGANNHIMSISASGSVHGWRLLMATGGECQVGHTGATGATFDTSINTATAGAWNHFGARFGSNTSRGSILNGLVLGSNASNSGNVGSPVRTSIGVRDINVPAAFFGGTIGPCAIWNVSLTEEEFKALAAGWSPRRVRPSALVFYAPFLTTGTIQDWYGNNMAVTGGTASDDGPPCELP
jgi:hypothetical protein